VEERQQWWTSSFRYAWYVDSAIAVSASEPLRGDRRLGDPHGLGAPIVDDEQPRGGRTRRAPGTGVDGDRNDAAAERARIIVLAVHDELGADPDELQHNAGP
jgi:hypothetical protein